MYVFLFFCTMLVPLEMIVLGNRYRRKPPKEISDVSGYRTSMSKLNNDTWRYSHNFIGKLWLFLGIILLIITIIIMVVIKNKNNFETLATYLTFAQLAIMCITILPTEIRLHKIFDSKGNRR